MSQQSNGYFSGSATRHRRRNLYPSDIITISFPVRGEAADPRLKGMYDLVVEVVPAANALCRLRVTENNHSIAAPRKLPERLLVAMVVFLAAEDDDVGFGDVEDRVERQANLAGA